MIDVDAIMRELLRRDFEPETSEPEHPAAALMGGSRVRSQSFMESGGEARPVSEEAVMAEARRLGLRGQVSAHELAEIRKKLAGEPYRPSHAEICERAGATMSHVQSFPFRPFGF